MAPTNEDVVVQLVVGMWPADGRPRDLLLQSTEGELDFGRLTEELTGETSIYKRRGMAQPDLGRPQIKYDASSSVAISSTDGAAGRRGSGSCST